MTRKARYTTSSVTTMNAASVASSSLSGMLNTELELGSSSVFEDHTALFIIPNI